MFFFYRSSASSMPQQRAARSKREREDEAHVENRPTGRSRRSSPQNFNATPAAAADKRRTRAGTNSNPASDAVSSSRALGVDIKVRILLSWQFTRVCTAESLDPMAVHMLSCKCEKLFRRCCHGCVKSVICSARNAHHRCLFV